MVARRPSFKGHCAMCAFNRSGRVRGLGDGHRMRPSILRQFAARGPSRVNRHDLGDDDDLATLDDTFTDAEDEPSGPQWVLDLLDREETMHWNHRVYRRTVDGETEYSIREAYTDLGGPAPHSWTADPIAAVEGDVDALRRTLVRMLAATYEPVLDDGAPT